jgi:plasmid maintenance system antidote protein VapI
MNNKKIQNIPETTQDEFAEIMGVVKNLCKEHLNEEYYELAQELAAKLARKRPSPLLSGRPNTWAAGIIHALGMVNFLFDKSQAPYLSSKDLSEWFGLSQNTIGARSKSIRDMFKIRQLDPRWTLRSNLDNNPMVWMIMVNGFIIDARKATYQIQEQAYNAGIIPYIPANKVTA